MSATAISKLFTTIQKAMRTSEFSYAHQDEADINQHILTKTHQSKASSLGQQPTLTFIPQNVQSTV
jgi:hypothetical protein